MLKKNKHLIIGGPIVAILTVALFLASKDRLAANSRGFETVEEYLAAREVGIDNPADFSQYVSESLEYALEQREALLLGFETVEQMQIARSKGFGTPEIASRAKEFGYENISEVQKDVNIFGFETSEEMFEARTRGFKTFVDFDRARSLGFETGVEYNAYVLQQAEQRMALDKGFASIEEMKAASRRGFDNKKTLEDAKIAGFQNYTDYKNFLDEQEEKKAIAKRQAEAAEALEQNKLNAKWLSDRFHTSASYACRPLVEDLALNTFRWTDGWLDSKFSSYRTTAKRPYVLTIVGDHIEFQNGFGAWRKTRYYCDYDVKAKKAITAGVQ
jgi:hypothetical protein